ncbi:MAG: glycosyltransferase [Anaerostipes hadrus]|nr:glycosyltransferase [Anaerostipes hadrus]
MSIAKISIIIPVYNIERYLCRCVDSVINQTMKPYEIILVDDGSKDGCAEICDNYEKNEDNIKVIHKKNEGLGFARNSGLEIATGDYIVFIDGDDYINSTRIETLYNCIRKNNADTCIASYTRVIDNNFIEIPNLMDGKILKGVEIIEEILPRMIGSKPDGSDSIAMSAWIGMFSNDIIKKYLIKFPSERELISEDIVFDSYYYVKSNVVCCCNDNGYYYCDNEDSLTTRYRKDRYQKQVVLFDYLSDRTQSLGIYPSCEQRLMTTLMSIARYSIKLEVQFIKENGKDVARKNILNICQSKKIHEIWGKYNNHDVNLKSRIINWLIVKKKINLLIAIMKIKIKMKI